MKWRRNQKKGMLRTFYWVDIILWLNSFQLDDEKRTEYENYKSLELWEESQKKCECIDNKIEKKTTRVKIVLFYSFYREIAFLVLIFSVSKTEPIKSFVHLLTTSKNLSSKPANSCSQQASLKKMLNTVVQRSARITEEAVQVDKDDPRARLHFIKYLKEGVKTVKLWECGICKREFRNQYSLVKHLPTHTGKSNLN